MNRAPAQPIVLAPPAVFAPPFVVGDASDEDAQVKKKKNEIKMVQHAVQHKLEKNVWEKKKNSQSDKPVVVMGTLQRCCFSALAHLGFPSSLMISNRSSI